LLTVANNKSAEKRMRQDRVRRDRNRSDRSELRTAIKKVRRALETGQVEEAKSLLPTAIQIIDVTAKKGVIHRNAADRNKSRLTRAVAAASAQ
jgi:small subunit ribosomal protein S20